MLIAHEDLPRYRKSYFANNGKGYTTFLTRLMFSGSHKTLVRIRIP